MNMVKHFRFAPFLALMALLLSAPLAQAESTPIGSMATILSGMNHFPSDAEKQTLTSIIENDANSQATRTIADAIRDIQHKATNEDMQALKDVVTGSSASEAEKELATIVMGFHHKASAGAKQKLSKLASD